MFKIPWELDGIGMKYCTPCHVWIIVMVREL